MDAARAIALINKGDKQRALGTSFQRALKIAPNNLAALAGAAQIEYQDGTPNAVPLLNRLLQLAPGGSHRAHAHAGGAGISKGKTAAAGGSSFPEKAGELLDSQIDGFARLRPHAWCDFKRLDAARDDFTKDGSVASDRRARA